MKSCRWPNALQRTALRAVAELRRHRVPMRPFCFFAMVCLVSGCVGVEVGRPYPLPYRPFSLLWAAQSAGHIVVTNLSGVSQASPKAAGYSLTLAGPEMKRLLDALTALQTHSSRILESSATGEWQLQCYSGSNILATAIFSRDVLFCDQVEFHAPRELRRLYWRVTRESAADH
jgi:hypothetical protein